MELYAAVRRSVYVEGLSERAAARRFGLARETVRKMLRYRRPPGYRRGQPRGLSERLDCFLILTQRDEPPTSQPLADYRAALSAAPASAS